MGMVVSLAFIPIFLLSLALPILIGVYVYRDANKRGMNGVLWMLVAILAPTFIGLIIYLLVRSNYSDMNCPACGTRVTETYMVCPNCGTKLRPTCPNCATPVQPEWKVCPQCAEPLPTTYSNVTSPEKPKDNTLFKILIAVLLVPVLLVVLIVVLLTARMRTQEEFQTFGSHNVPFFDFKDEFINRDVEIWLEDCKTLSNSYGTSCSVLRYTTEVDDNFHTEYLVYIPGGCQINHVHFDTDNKFFGDDVYNIQISGSIYGDIKNFDDYSDPEINPHGEFEPYIAHMILLSSDPSPSELKFTFNGIDMEEFITDTSVPFYSDEEKSHYYDLLHNLNPFPN